MSKRIYAYDEMQNSKRRKTDQVANATTQRYSNMAPFSSNARAGYTTVPRTRGVYAAGEMKYFDSARDVAALTALGNHGTSIMDPNALPVAGINCLFCPTQGSGINQRIGKGCKLMKIKIAGTIVCPAIQDVANSLASGIVRIMLVQDMQTNATQMTGTQLLTTATSTSLAINSFQNSDNFGRFRVLKDKKFSLKIPAVDYDGAANHHDLFGQMINFKINHTFAAPLEVRFNAVNGGTIADIVDHSFHLFAETNSTDLQPNISYNCRCSFKE